MIWDDINDCKTWEDIKDCMENGEYREIDIKDGNTFLIGVIRCSRFPNLKSARSYAKRHCDKQVLEWLVKHIHR